MTTFKQVCMELFHRRNRYVKFFLTVQALVVIFYSLFIIVSHNKYSLLGYEHFTGWLIPYAIVIQTTMIFDLVFLGWVIFKNEKWQFSQTWRLIPISDSKLFLANITSTLLNCIVIFISQILVLSLLNGATSFVTSNSFSTQNFWKGVTAFWINSGDPKGLEMCLNLVAC